MTHVRDRLPAIPPTVPAPPRFVDRRVHVRRASDRQLLDERRLLANALDVLVGAPSAEARLAGVLELLATTAGATRAAVLAPLPERRIAVTVRDDEPAADAEALAAWLDTAAPRSRARRAASGPAAVSLVTHVDEPLGRPRRPVSPAAHEYAWLPMPGGELALGFDCPSGAAAAQVVDRLPQQLLRHATVVLSLAAEQLAAEREIAALRARDLERETFVSVVAHELRTPLTGLTGYLDLILDGRVDEATRTEFLERSRSIAGTMAELVGDLLELARIEAGTLQLEIAPFPLAGAISRVLETVAPLALEREIELRADLPPRLRMASGDRRRVEQIMTNLVGNALKFASAGGVVEVVGAIDGPVAIVLVRDDGPGMAPDERPRIFERFHRLERDGRIAGTGLGLAIARDLARAMEGELDLASVQGAGSTFVLALPGPSGVDTGVLAEAIERRLAAEASRLEQSALIARLPGARARPPGVRASRRAGPTPSVAQPERPRLRLLPDPIPAASRPGG